MAVEIFEAILEQLSAEHKQLSSGKMMSSPAIHYKGKVLAFFSRKETMVFKLGKDYPVETLKVRVEIFSPFKSKKPFSGWYEVSQKDSASWLSICELALTIAKNNFM